MNRNTESRFAVTPQANLNRSKFPLDFNVKTSMNVGELVPICKPIEILPGDTLQIRTSKVLRMPALITPIMDSLYWDTYFFFVPNRLVYNRWKEVMGENTASAWLPAVSYSNPVVTAPASTGWTQGTIADYFGIPTGVPGKEVLAFPFRAYALIVNEFFRSEVVQDPANVPVDGTTVTGSNGSNYITDLCKGGKPFIANKFFDVFTGATRAPQKGPDVAIPVATMDPLPVTVGDIHDVKMTGSNYDPLGMIAHTAGGTTQFYTDFNNNAIRLSTDGTPDSNTLGPNNLWAIQSGVASAATINELRMAFQIQKLFERDSVAGSRYREILRAHFSVTSPDARMQIPEYLGGNRISLRISQVLQQSETSTTPQGTPTGVSLTVDSHYDVNKSFTEHGFVIALGVARYKHSYQQGLDRLWTRRERLDYYWPVLANIGNQPILNQEIYCQGPSVVDTDGKEVDEHAFGYQDAWYDYRYIPDMTTSMMRSQYSASLDVWHLGDDYSSLPTLSSGWLQEDKTNVDRVLTVKSAVTNQIFCDFHFSGSMIRCMPFYSTPGLIDHH